MFYEAKRDQLYKLQFMTDYHLRNLAFYKHQTSLPNIDQLSSLVAACLVWSKIDLADVYFYISIEESSEKWKTILTTHGKMRSRKISWGDCNTPGTSMEGIIDIFMKVGY